MRIAIVGTGIAGMACAYLLQRQHQITVFERNDYTGGHTNTVGVDDAGRELGIDTGFIVYNPANYPNLVRLFDRLGVATQETDMSFSVRCRRCQLEFSPPSPRGLFAQRRNLLRPSFYRMLLDARRFLADARTALADESRWWQTLGEFSATMGYGRGFVDHLLVPLAAAIWSAGPSLVREMPVGFALRFLDNHGMLDPHEGAAWRTVVGGSRSYVRAITADFRDAIRLRNPVTRVTRDPDGVRVSAGGEELTFDGVVIAAHADEALAMLADPSEDERRLLGAFSYSRNHTVLHTDATVLPTRPTLHASWNYELEDCTADEPKVSLTYYMNRLQRVKSSRHYCVTLNRARPIDEARVLRRIEYTHPVFTRASLAAQKELPRLNGVRRTWYCGAYQGYGFHEDGLVSALRVAADFGAAL